MIRPKRVTKKKPWSITTFAKVNMTEEELEEKHRQVIEEYEEPNKQKLLNIN